MRAIAILLWNVLSLLWDTRRPQRQRRTHHHSTRLKADSLGYLDLLDRVRSTVCLPACLLDARGEQRGQRIKPLNNTVQHVSPGRRALRAERPTLQSHMQAAACLQHFLRLNKWLLVFGFAVSGS